MSTTSVWWRDEPYYERISGELDQVEAIDVHTHLLRPGSFNPELDASMPLRLRSTEPTYAAAMAERFGAEIGRDGLVVAEREAARVRSELIERLGVVGYWRDHLDFTKTDIALVNQEGRIGIDGDRLRWVPYATDLLYPLPADSIMARSPAHAEDIGAIQARLRGYLSEAGLDGMPSEIDEYIRFMMGTLRRWRGEGAVAVKFVDAYLRSTAFGDVSEATAQTLYRKSRDGALPFDEYIAVQDFIARRIFLEAGKLDLAIHIHSSYGVPPFLRLQDADVRNLEPVLTDIRFFSTQFVLIHGGSPQHEDAAYLALKPHVWLDISAMPFLYSVPEFAAVVRIYLQFAPEKVLFGTDAANYPGIPVGPEVQHIALSRHTREALALALAGMVRDQLLDLESAIYFGKGVLRGNAERLLAAHLSRATTEGPPHPR